MMPVQKNPPDSSPRAMIFIMALALIMATLLNSQTILRNLVSVQLNRQVFSFSLPAKRWEPNVGNPSGLPLSYAIYSLGQIDAGKTELLLDMLNNNPNHPLLHFALGERYYQAGDADQALLHWRSVPDVDIYFAIRSTLAISKQNETAAMEYANISRQIDPQDSFMRVPMLRDLCRWFYERKDYQTALPWCHSYAALDASPTTNLLLANVLAGAGKLSEAIDVLRTIIAGDQTQAHGQAYFILGEVQRRAGDYQAARSAYELSLQSGYDQPWVWISLANTYRQLGEMPKACQVYQAAIQSGYTPDPVNLMNFSDCVR